MAKMRPRACGVFVTGCASEARRPATPHTPGRAVRPRPVKSASLANRRARAEIERSAASKVFAQWQPAETSKAGCEEGEEAEDEDVEHALDWQREPKQAEVMDWKMPNPTGCELSGRSWQDRPIPDDMEAFSSWQSKRLTAPAENANSAKEHFLYKGQGKAGPGHCFAGRRAGFDLQAGACSEMMRCVESYEGSDLSAKEEILYKTFTKGLLNEAANWEFQSFEDMQSALEPVVLSEPLRKYDINECERMMRVNEKENEWLDAQRKKADDLVEVRVRLVTRSTASMADSVAKVKKVLMSLVQEIAEGMRQHNNLVKEHEATEAELYELDRKQKLMLHSVTLLEERRRDATERYARELEGLKTEYVILKRGVESAYLAFVQDRNRCIQVWKKLRTLVKSQMLEQMSVMGEAHAVRLRRQGEVHRRQGVTRLATLEKDIQHLRRRLRARQQDLEEAQACLEAADPPAGGPHWSCQPRTTDQLAIWETERGLNTKADRRLRLLPTILTFVLLGHRHAILSNWPRVDYESFDTFTWMYLEYFPDMPRARSFVGTTSLQRDEPAAKLAGFCTYAKLLPFARFAIPILDSKLKVLRSALFRVAAVEPDAVEAVCGGKGPLLLVWVMLPKFEQYVQQPKKAASPPDPAQAQRANAAIFTAGGEMSKWQLGDSGVFSLTGCHIGACNKSLHPRSVGRHPHARLEKSPSLATRNKRARAEIEKSAVFAQWRPAEIPQEEEAVPTSSAPLALQAAQDGEEESDEEDNMERLLDWRREPTEKDLPQGKMTVTSSREISARMRWQVAFAKVREKTGVARRNQHRIALTNKVKEYLMYTNSRSSCAKLMRTLDGYDRSNFTEREEITYEKFTEGLLDEAESWVSKNFEDMQSALEPVVLSEPSRKYDMNEFERMMRMNEHENQWLDAQRKKTDDLMEVHLRLVTRSTASMADSVEKVKKVLTSLVQEIAEGMHRHNNLVKEHEATEAELFELARKQKLMLTSIAEFEERKREATERYARELESLKTECLGYIYKRFFWFK
ncbi:unnamed protein product [Symbiodinium natans]|uniref:Uncharacterized protein n=1 Tax=Symbiodinium natans TaxID=878477 RepID=A0A812ST22_9DINO|nr:unnamed protein product [Symbiodinium natans]